MLNLQDRSCVPWLAAVLMAGLLCSPAARAAGVDRLEPEDAAPAAAVERASPADPASAEDARVPPPSPPTDPAAVPTEPTAPAADGVAPPPTNGAPDPFLSSLGSGTGPGLPWQVVLVVQLFSYALADALPYLGCVACSWVLSLVVALGSAPALPAAVVLSLALIPLAALASGIGSAALMQWLGDRLGYLRGRLLVVGLSSILLSLVTYALVIFPIIVGMGFFSVAAYSFLSASANLVLPELEQRALPWWASAAGYSVSAAGLVAAVVVVAAGAVLAPLVGFVIRPVLVALAYRITGRAREPGEEQWPPSLFGERADLLPWPFVKRKTVSPAKPAFTSPNASEPTGPQAAPPAGPGSQDGTSPPEEQGAPGAPTTAPEEQPLPSG